MANSLVLSTAKRLVPLQAALSQSPHSVSLLRKIARLFASRNMLPGAVSYAQQALGIRPDHAPTHRDLGEYYYREGRRDEALFHLRRAATLDPQSADSVRWLAVVLCSNKDFDVAVSLLRQAAELPSRKALTLSMLSKAHYDRGDFPAAVRLAEEAVRAAGGAYCAKVNLTHACCLVGDFERALKYAREEAKARPRRGLYLLGLVLGRMNRVEEQVLVCRRLVRLKPEDAAGHFLLAWSLLMLGDYRNGWQEYEWRLRDGRNTLDQGKFRSRLTEPMWDGQDIRGKTILVHGEQGFGDNIQFIRYINCLLECGARVLLLAPRELVPLYRQLPGVSYCCGYMDAVPRYDYHIVVGSLPRIFTRNVSDIPHHVPYVFAQVRNGRTFNAQHAQRLNVGIVWAGTKLGPDDQRAISIKLFSELFQLESIDFYSLQVQVGPKSEDIIPYLGKNVFDVSDRLQDFEDTAVALKGLDLLVTVDSGIAHLGGALGRKVFMLLPFAADFRWLRNDPTSCYHSATPWYPTMRLFRKRYRGCALFGAMPAGRLAG